MNERPTHLYPLTSLRFFAAAAIVIFHICSFFQLPTTSNLANGVSFFFVLSGFILTYNYQNLSGRIGTFYVSRFARLWPIHLLTMAIVAAFLPTTEGFGATVMNILLLHAWIPTTGFVFSYNAVSWSISAEVFFYAVFPLLLATRRLGFWYLGILVATVLVVTAAEYFPDRGEFKTYLFILQNPLVRFLEFATGVLAARCFERHRLSVSSFPLWTAMEIATIALFFLFALYRQHWLGSIYTQGYKMWAIWLSQSGGFFFFGLLIYVFAHGLGAVSRLLSLRVFVLLGEISFATYMLHQIVLRWFVAGGFKDQFGLWPSIVLILLVSYLGSWLAWRYVEVPARQFIISSFKKRAGQQATV